jgi:hypothetical protein
MLPALHQLRSQTSVAALLQSFANPADTAKPIVRWWWFGIAVEKAEILRELGGGKLPHADQCVGDRPSHQV